MTTLILASASPRRAQLLTQLGVVFEQQSADIDEHIHAGEDPQDYVTRLAREKAAQVQLALGTDVAILAADTSVVLDGIILGKPVDHFDGLGTLARLSGREHRVLTAVCVRRGEQVEEAVSDTKVKFVTLDRQQCEAYLATDEPWDKAGSYGIQGLAGAFVDTIEGSYSGVVGLPLSQTWALLQRIGVSTGLEPGSGD